MWQEKQKQQQEIVVNIENEISQTLTNIQHLKDEIELLENDMIQIGNYLTMIYCWN